MTPLRPTSPSTRRQEKRPRYKPPPPKRYSPIKAVTSVNALMPVIRDKSPYLAPANAKLYDRQGYENSCLAEGSREARILASFKLKTFSLECLTSQRRQRRRKRRCRPCSKNLGRRCRCRLSRCRSKERQDTRWQRQPPRRELASCCLRKMRKTQQQEYRP